MPGQLTGFQINKLYGHRNFDLKFRDNTIILVGENGTGKTTVLRLLYYLLSGEYGSLAQYNFDNIAIFIDNTKHILSKEELLAPIKVSERPTFSRLPRVIRRRLYDMIDRKAVNAYELEELSNRFDIPVEYLVDEINESRFEISKNTQLKTVSKAIQESLNSQVLYLPTYRRIERELKLIFRGVDDYERQAERRLRLSKESNPSLELVEFGMNDVEELITNNIGKLKDFVNENLINLTLGNLGDVVDEKYANVDLSDIRRIRAETINNVLDSIHKSILSSTQKQHLLEKINNVRSGNVRSGSEINVHTKIICHYFLQVLNFQKELKKREKQISDFCNVCNQYMGNNKTFVYKSTESRFLINTKGAGKKEFEIKLSQLSSGEKQIVSLFSHLYLSKQKHFFVIIDEPELSLSVPWQRRFLVDIRNGNFCSGLIAATHSPFIYENELEKYAHGLGEFTKK